MHARRVGRSGLKVSALGLGTYLTAGAQLDAGQALRCLRRAVDLGITLIDTADAYAEGEAERIVGLLVREVDRRQLVIATKCYFPTGPRPTERGLSRKHLFEAVHASLRRLGTDYVDLLQCHRFDDETPLEETLTALDDLIRQGKVLAWGVSRWSVSQLEAASAVCAEAGLVAPIATQEPYHLLYRGLESELAPWCAARGLGVLAYAPLAQGVLTGKYRAATDAPSGSRAASAARGSMYQLTARDLSTVERLRPIAQDLGVELAQLALAFVLHLRPVASALVGASRPEHLEANVRACELRLSPEVLARIDSALAPTT